MSIGVVNTSTPAHRGAWEVSIKGAGPTPFSRRGDGRAVLQSNCREFLGSVALHALGIPAQRALCVVAADVEFDGIIRDALYQGQPARHAPGTLTRVTKSFFRFGTAQLVARTQGVLALVALARIVLRSIAELEAAGDPSARVVVPEDPELSQRCFGQPRSLPSCASRHRTLSDTAALQCLLERAADRTGALIAAWQAAGLAHGVMNTDNLSLLGITIDLNVFGFLDHWDPFYVPNLIDDEARYAFGEQKNIGWWNIQVSLGAPMLSGGWHRQQWQLVAQLVVLGWNPQKTAGVLQMSNRFLSQAVVYRIPESEAKNIYSFVHTFSVVTGLWKERRQHAAAVDANRITAAPFYL